METARAQLEASLREEQQMANWIDSNVDKVTMEYVNRRQRQAA